MAVVVYDIQTRDPAGRGRLRKIERACRDWGIPVQNSVVECRINADELRRMQEDFRKIIDESVDSVRIYLLGNRYENKILQFGNNGKTRDWETFVL